MRDSLDLLDKGHSRHSGYARDGDDWYVEPGWEVDQLLDAIDFSVNYIWDPACGQGTILESCWKHSRKPYGVFGSDIVDRGSEYGSFALSDFLRDDPPERVRSLICPELAIICNPPYGRLEPDMPRGDTFAERFVRRALDLPEVRRAAFIVNGKFLWSERRWHLFDAHPPTQLLFCSERPSMPPGAELPRLIAEGRAYQGGSADYVWIYYERGAAPRPPAWLRPRSIPA
jgi:hypothetical protein